MRKVYHSENTSSGLLIALTFAFGMTAVLFCVLPFSHIIAKPGRLLELRKTTATDLPPPVAPEPPPPPPQTEQQQEPPPAPQLAETPQQIPLTADLDVAIGSGGALAGFGEIRALTAAGAVKEDAFSMADLEKHPEAVSQVPPAYPAELRKAKIEGLVTLMFVLGEDGRVEDPRVESSTRPEFEKPALEAIRKWRFRPGLKDGQPVRNYVRIPMRFRIAS